MELHSNIKILIYTKGYKSIKQFTDKHELNYGAVVRLANNEVKSIDKDLIIALCDKLDCDLTDIFEIKRNGQVS